MSLFEELRRRNVFRVAAAYTLVAWVLAQVADVAFDNFGAPDWVSKSVLFILILGFPLAVFFAWAFEMTPEGVKLEKDVDRSQSITQQTGRKLNYLIIAGLTIAVGFLLVDKFALRTDTEMPVAGHEPVAEVKADVEKSVAVLPFVAMSSGPDDEFFADGITEEILNSLAQLPDLLVTARTSAFSFKGMDVPIPEIAAQLGVANVVEGSVRRSGDRLRVTAQLIRAEDGFHLWSETYDRSAADSFAVQDEIAQKVATALDVVLDEDSVERMRSVGLRDPEAFVAFQKGRKAYDDAHALAFVEMSTGLEEANDWFKRTIELEPAASQAYFQHADYYIHIAVESGDSLSQEEIDAALDAAKADLRKAMEVANDKAQRLDIGLEYTLIAEEWARMAELYESALQFDGCLDPAWWAAIGPLHASKEETIALWRRAVECDPLSFYNWGNLSMMLSLAGQADEAIEVGTRAMQIVPHRQIADHLVSAYLVAGRTEDARNANQRHTDDARARLFNEFRVLAAEGREAEARATLDAAMKQYGPESVSPELFAMLGDREAANRKAAEVDAGPLGYLALLDSAGNCRCGAPFDLESAPVVARAIEEAGLQWPPENVIQFPLKDW
jgi:TolB-like protein/tetratricopeptide (TPR) repeat protein